MRAIIGLALAGLLLGGCAIYAEPGVPYGGVYVAPPPVVVAPAYPWWGWHGGWHGHGR